MAVKSSHPHPTGAFLHVSGGSLVNFSGAAVVNAANVLCQGGGGLDAVLSKAGGPALAAARRDLPEIPGTGGHRCRPGEAVVTTGGSLLAAHCIHACGPDFRDDGYTEEEGHYLLHAAYVAAMVRGRGLGAATIGFPMLSAGVFRGGQALAVLADIAVDAIWNTVYSGLEAVCIVGHTADEIEALRAAADALTANAAPGGVALGDDAGVERGAEFRGRDVGVAGDGAGVGAAGVDVVGDASDVEASVEGAGDGVLAGVEAAVGGGAVGLATAGADATAMPDVGAAAGGEGEAEVGATGEASAVTVVGDDEAINIINLLVKYDAVKDASSAGASAAGAGAGAHAAPTGAGVVGGGAGVGSAALGGAAAAAGTAGEEVAGGAVEGGAAEVDDASVVATVTAPPSPPPKKASPKKATPVTRRSVRKQTARFSPSDAGGGKGGKGGKGGNGGKGGKSGKGGTGN